MKRGVPASLGLAPAIIFLSGACVLWGIQAPQKPIGPRVRYAIVGGGAMSSAALFATVDGKSYQVIPKSQKKCLNIVSQRDFDGSGTVSALVEHSVACGGNCCPNAFFFVSYAGDGQFKVSKEFADSWKDPEIEKWKGRWSVVVVSNNEGVNRERPVEITRRFVLENGDAVKIEEHQRQDIPALVEMRSEIFKSDDPQETHTISYDLDGDGKKDVITGKLWERWGRILWSVRFADGKEFSSDDACKRIGVLASKTNGVHNLVCDQDTVFHWDGSAYK